MNAGALDYLPKEKLHPDLVAHSVRAALIFRQAQREKQAILDALRESEQRSRQMIDAIPHVAWITEPDGSVNYYNQRWYEYSGLTQQETQDWSWEAVIHPDDLKRADSVWRTAVESGVDSEVEYRLRHADGLYRWHLGRSQPVKDTAGEIKAWVGTATDIEERKQTEELLIRSQEDLQFSVSAARLGTFYCEWPLDKIIWNETCKEHFFLSPNADVDIKLFYSLLHPADREPTRLAIEQAMANQVEYNVEYRTLAPDGRTRWVNAVGRFQYHEDGTPKRFDGITIDIATRKANEEAIKRRAEREALLNRIGHALRVSLDPQTILETAVRELGQALSADRCYYASYDQNTNVATIGPDWSAAGLSPISGQYPMLDFAVNHDPIFQAGRTQVMTDTSPDLAMLNLGIRSLVRVPLVSGAVKTALSAAMSNDARAWTPEEISLVETVATQTQTALEAARLLHREHNIAEQLQSALQPIVPQSIPGLEVGSFTRPALDEASVGGDFMDVFALDKGLFALVIGDVSGKGLAAAQQLALIRNSLRMALYQHNSPAVAATTLNSTVTSHDLLIGFVTAWVGVYDAATGQITYCSCGHEPALIRRANGTIQTLETSTPPLGVTANAHYSDCVITLASGDALLLYTDGVSEAGPSRRDLLGTDGLIRLLDALRTDTNAQQQAETIVAEASAYANGAFSDDVAVLLARRQ
ncbi:hypothetical protein CCAX7_60080 [Capsulimonas corticalis]|uniref:PAS domain S-box protein n=2 Tax=Capsulimonas corticalis TaxID=2219043 RepID=A0A9N7L445_9BACT|nr:hypothetical protein CCAX7_26250 [Capsulimonas corticalis]BDI33957.1 hypothetical protein CCAX7_60080 [Capsulimonas corticalis]